MAEVSSSIARNLLSIRKQIEREARIPFGSTLIKLTNILQAIQSVADDAETKQRSNHQVKNWLQHVKEICYDVEDVLDEWSTFVLKRQIKEEEAGGGPRQQQQLIGDRLVLFMHELFSTVLSNFSICSCLGCDETGQHHRFARDLKALSEQLAEVWYDANFLSLTVGRQTVDEKVHFPRLTTSFIDTTEVWGRDDEKKKVVCMLLDDEASENRSSSSSAETTTTSTRPLQIISIVGMGGIGKTTLAKLCYNDERVKFHFEHRIWVSVPQDFDEKDIAKAILESQLLEKLAYASPNSLELATLLQLMDKYVQGKKILLVLDDVWEQDPYRWEKLLSALRSGSRGSRILVTTRNRNVAMASNSQHIFELEGLAVEDCWSIFRHVALQGYNDGKRYFMEDVGRQIVERCQGMPLVAKTLAAVVRTKRSRAEWLQVLRSDIFNSEDVLSVLLLSYYDMPQAMRVCFSYCATFPRGFQIEKLKLIRLWMAQGYLLNGEEPNEDFETVGEEYISNLVMRSLLWNSTEKEDEAIGRRKVEMHDLVHGLARWCSQGECLSVELNSHFDIPSEARHLTLMLSEEGQLHKVQDFISRHNKLRSLLLQSKRSLSGIEMRAQLSRLFTQMTLLRSLDLTGCAFRVLPPTIRNLVLLRLLILSMNEELEELPQEICDLCNLQTLEVNWCKYLRGFPEGIGNLINLRHLGNLLGSRSAVYLPKGIARLIALRTLLEFNVGCDSESASLADLRDLNQLGGHVCINGLGNVTDVSDAREARLQRKRSITSLELNFQREEDRVMEPMDEVLIEALQPHPNLQELAIVRYQGNRFPSWLLTLLNLQKIALLECDSCQSLPPLGKIPCLEELVIHYMPLVKTMGRELLGMEDDTIAAGVPSSSSVTAFPALIKLKISNMPRWREWSNWSSSRNEDQVSLVFPSLRSLWLEDCPKLGSLPDKLLQSTCLEALNIYHCPMLELRYAKNGNDWHRVANIPKIQMTPPARRDSL